MAKANPLLILLCLATMAAAPPRSDLALTPRPPIAPGVDALPRISHPTGSRIGRINRALDADDARIRAALAECRRDAGKGTEAYWRRAVSVAMRGPRYLAISISDNTDCGGAHPNQDIFALVFDLRTGRPVDWRHLLGKSLAGTTSADEADDETPLRVVASPELTGFFLAALAEGGNPECEADLRAIPGPLHFIVWPDAKDDALELYSQDVPFVLGPCAGPASIPTPSLRKAGADPALLRALAAE